jgi:hypothetical protein
VRRGQSRIPSNNQSSGGTRNEQEHEHERLPEDDDNDNEGERKGDMEKRKRRLLANCARQGLRMTHMSDDEDAELSLPTTTDITSAPAEESPHLCCPTCPSWTSYSST